MRKGESVMPTLAISEAKNKLTSLRREALTGKEIILDDAKRKDDGPVSLISTALLDELCSGKVFTYEWADEPGNGQENYSLWNHETGVYGVGSTKDEAIEDYIDNIIDYANVYYSDLPYYLSHSGNTYNHYWYLRRVVRCNGDRKKLYQILNLESLIE
jgi:hypothetical protein